MIIQEAIGHVGFAPIRDDDSVSEPQRISKRPRYDKDVIPPGLSFKAEVLTIATNSDPHAAKSRLMKPDLTNALCLRCGLCCNGSLFADAELASRETTALELLGVEIEDGDKAEPALLLQPCAAFKRKRCSIYLHRPNCCRTFECRLLKQAESGAISIDRAKEKIANALKEVARVKALIGQLGQRDERLSLKERFSDALALSSHITDDQEMNRKGADAKIAITRVQNLLQQTFLGRLKTVLRPQSLASIRRTTP